MRKSELIAKLNSLEGNPEVMIPSVDFDSIYDLINTVQMKNIRFHECEESEQDCTCKAVAHENCIILES